MSSLTLATCGPGGCNARFNRARRSVDALSSGAPGERIPRLRLRLRLSLQLQLQLRLSLPLRLPLRLI